MEGLTRNVWIEVAQREDKDWDTIAGLLGSSKELQAITQSFTRVITEDEESEDVLRPHQLLQFSHLERVEHPVEIANERELGDIIGVIQGNPRLGYIFIQFGEKLDPRRVWTYIFALLEVSRKDITYELSLWNGITAIVDENSLCLIGAPSNFSFNAFLIEVNQIRPLKRLFSSDINIVPAIKTLTSLEELTLDFTRSSGFNYYDFDTGRTVFSSSKILALMREMAKSVWRLGFYVGDGYGQGNIWNYEVTGNFINAFSGDTFPSIRELDFPTPLRYLGYIRSIFPNLRKPLISPPRKGEDISQYLVTVRYFASSYREGYRLIPGVEYPPDIPGAEHVKETLYTDIDC